VIYIGPCESLKWGRPAGSYRYWIKIGDDVNDNIENSIFKQDHDRKINVYSRYTVQESL
jgi:hypothetical protein